MRPGSLARRTLVAPLLRRLLPKAARVADVGGYDGAVSAPLREHARLVVLDLDLAGLELARRRGLLGVRGSISALPLRPHTLDLVLFCDVLPALAPEAWEGALAEAARAVKPGGLLLLTTPLDDFRLPGVEASEMNRTWRVNPGPSRAALAALLTQRGFVTVEQHLYYGVATRWFYAACFYRNLPPRGMRIKRWLWRVLTWGESIVCFKPQAILIVARFRTETCVGSPAS